MVAVRVDRFTGEIPTAGDDQLPQGAAHEAVGTWYHDGGLSPHRLPADTGVRLDDAYRSIFRFRGPSDKWLGWYGRNVRPVVVANEGEEANPRLFWSDQGLRWSTWKELPGTTYAAGVPAPRTERTILMPDSMECPNERAIRSYVFTWVTPWFDEGISSLPSKDRFGQDYFAPDDDEGVMLSMMPTERDAPSGHYVRGFRLYRRVGQAFLLMRNFWFPRPVPRTATSTVRQVNIVFDEPHNLGAGDRVRLSRQGANYDGIADDITDAFTVTIRDIIHSGGTASAAVPTDGLTLQYDVAQNGNVEIFQESDRDAPNYWTAGRTTFVDDYDPVQLGQQLSSQNNSLPPEDLNGFVELPGRVYAGVRGRSLYMSVPGRPGAWPAAFSRTYPNKTVAVQPSGTSAIVLTDAEPIQIYGFDTDPANVTEVGLEVPWACTSPASVTSLLGSVYWSSTVGLCRYSAAKGPGVATHGLFHWKDWVEDVELTEVWCVPWNGMVVVRVSKSETFLFDDRESSPTLTKLITNANAAFFDKLTGSLFMIEDRSFEILPQGQIESRLHIEIVVNSPNQDIGDVLMSGVTRGAMQIATPTKASAGG